MTLRKNRDINSINSASIAAVTNISILRDALDDLRKDVAARISLHRARAQKLHNAKKIVYPLEITIGDNVMIRTHAMKGRKRQPQRRSLMRVVEARSDLVFVVENINDSGRHRLHARRVVPYPVKKQSTHPSVELVQQAAHFDKRYHLVETVAGVRKQKGANEIGVRWVGCIIDNDDT